MSVKGIGGRRKLSDCVAGFNNLVKIQQGKHFDVKKRKARAIETTPRDLKEARFRNEEVYPFLRTNRKILDYKRIENAICNKHGRGIPDFLFWTEKNEYWLELKADDGKLSEAQEEFKEHCRRTKGIYIEARTIQDILDTIELVEGGAR